MNSEESNLNLYQLHHVPVAEPIRLLYQQYGKESRGIRVADYLWRPLQALPPCWAKICSLAAEFLQKLQRDPTLSTDAYVGIWVSPDQLIGWAMVFPPLNGGADVTEDSFRAALDAAQITYGINEEYLAAMVGQKAYMKLAKIATGVPPHNGENGRIVDLALADDASALPEDEYGRVDFKDLGWIKNVEQGQRLCQIIPPTSGRDGISVLSKRLLAKAGRPAPYVAGDHTEFTEDGAFLVASVDGQVSRKAGRYVVTETLTIQGNVDYSTGNINVNGSVIIMGDVYPTFKVEAKKDIVVYGTVDGGILTAGGDISVYGGVLASNQGVLQAGGNLRCKFMEYGTAYAGGNAYFENLIHSTVNCEGDIFVTSGRGAVIGGKLIAMGNITINTVGNRANCATYLQLGATEDFTDRKHHLVVEISTLTAKINRITAVIEKLRGMPNTDAEKLQKLEAVLPIERIRMQRLQSDMQEIEQLEGRVTTGHISIGRSYPNVNLKLGGTSMHLDEECRDMVYHFKEGKIITVHH